MVTMVVDKTKLGKRVSRAKGEDGEALKQAREALLRGHLSKGTKG